MRNRSRGHWWRGEGSVNIIWGVRNTIPGAPPAWPIVRRQISIGISTWLAQDSNNIKMHKIQKSKHWLWDSYLACRNKKAKYTTQKENGSLLMNHPPVCTSEINWETDRHLWFHIKKNNLDAQTNVNPWHFCTFSKMSFPRGQILQLFCRIKKKMRFDNKEFARVKRFVKTARHSTQMHISAEIRPNWKPCQSAFDN